MAMTTDARPAVRSGEMSPPPGSPNFSRMIRSDLWRLFVTLGVLFAVVVSMLAAKDRSGGAAPGGGAIEVELSEWTIEPVVRRTVGGPVRRMCALSRRIG